MADPKGRLRKSTTPKTEKIQYIGPGAAVLITQDLYLYWYFNIGKRKSYDGKDIRSVGDEGYKMSVIEYFRETYSRFSNNSLEDALSDSAEEARKGIYRRTVDEWIGDLCWEREWDVLIILDACRVDLWRDVAPEYDLPEGDEVWSPGSCSPHWIARTFADERGRSAGYATGNPYSGYRDFQDSRLPLSDTDVGYLSEPWRDNFRRTEYGVTTVAPEVMTDHAIGAWRNRESLGIDRLIVHYMQPHQPFRSKPEWWKSPILGKMAEGGSGIGGQSIWEMDSAERPPFDDIWDAYRDNLAWVVDDLTRRLFSNIDGSIVVSADHGNAMGEWGAWGHPAWSPHPKIRKVPWVEIEGTDQHTIDGVVERHRDAETEDLNEKLQALGYT